MLRCRRSVKALYLVLTILVAVTLLSRAHPTLERYAAETPAFAPDRYFNGTLTSHGVMRDLFGIVRARFTMRMTARWEGERGTLDEAFTFADGHHAERHWQIQKLDATHYLGTAPDVPGGAKGEISGNALHWVYDITLPTAHGPQRVTFDDWLYLVDERTLFSFVSIRKWGIPVGDMVMVFGKD